MIRKAYFKFIPLLFLINGMGTGSSVQGAVLSPGPAASAVGKRSLDQMTGILLLRWQISRKDYDALPTKKKEELKRVLIVTSVKE